MNTTLQLTLDEKNILESLYGRQVSGTDGYNPRMLEDIVELTAQEKKFFAGKNFVSPHFFVQTLYKVRGNLNPLKFSTVVNRTINDNKNLRGNFCNVGTRTLKVIQPAQLVKPEIVFRNFTRIEPDELDDEFRKIMEADMRRDFDLRHEPLIRFAVYRTSDEEFAVLITMAQLIADSFDAEKFFAALTGTTAADKPQSQSDDLSPQNHEAIRNYWAKVLDKAPPPAKLPFEHENPGAYRQKAFRKKIPADILSDLRGRAQSNRTMLTAILLSAWGFMLQLTNKRNDCLFCQILSATDSLNVIPVRVTSDKISTVEQIVRKQFRQLVVSQPYSRVDRADLENLFGRGKKLFDHFLSFKEFQSNELNYTDTPADARGKIIVRNSWDAQGMKLGMYFRYSEKNLSVSFLYDERQFAKYGVERLFELYECVLKQMLVDWNAKYSDFIARLDNRVGLQLEEKFSREYDAENIRNFLSQLPILQGRFAGTIGLFDEHAELVTYYEGDRISGDMLAKNFIFVAEGKLARNVDTGDGWYMPLDIVARNGFVNPANLLDKQRLTLSAEVLTERVELLTIPHDILLDILRQNTDLSLTMMTFALEQMERWQLLWLQS